MNHSDLVEIGYNWLIKSVKCPFAFKELRTYALEEPDIIGWKNGESILIECKTSKADFLADRTKKYFRQHDYMGVGNYRFYLTTKGLLSVMDIPDKWCWIEADDNGNIIKRVAPRGNVWSNWPRFEAHLPSESIMMQSALRRVQKNGDLEKIFRS